MAYRARMRMYRCTSALIGALFSILATSCSDDPSDSSNQNVTSDLSCDVAPASELEAALGHSGLQEPAEETDYGVLTCSYATSTNANAVILRMTKTTEAGFEAGRQSFEDLGLTTVEIAGLGERAFSVSDGTGAVVSNTVIAWDGTVEVELTTTGSTVDALQSEVAKILTRLP